MASAVTSMMPRFCSDSAGSTAMLIGVFCSVPTCFSAVTVTSLSCNGEYPDGLSRTDFNGSPGEDAGGLTVVVAGGLAVVVAGGLAEAASPYAVGIIDRAV